MDLVLAGTTAGLAITAVVLALRCAGLKADAKDADHRYRMVEAQFQQLSREHKAHIEATDRHVQKLHEDIMSLEQDLEACNDPSVVRRRLRALLS